MVQVKSTPSLKEDQDAAKALLEGLLYDEPAKDLVQCLSERNIKKFGIIIIKLASLDLVDSAIRTACKDDGMYIIDISL